MSKKTKTLIKDTIEESEQLISLYSTHETQYIFKEIPPVLWFGDLKSAKEKILVISANPNKPDMPEDNPRIPYSTEWKKGGRDVTKLEKEYNEYFRTDLWRNPATNWFGQKDKDTGQGRIEQFLNGLDASFYENEKYKYQAIHIDLLPFATTKHFTKIADQLLEKNDWLSSWINKHIHDMIELIHPKLIIVNGKTNFYYFNLCVNIGAQPYTLHHYGKNMIWISNSSPKIIATSFNMGSSCRLQSSDLVNIGKNINSKI